MASKASEIAGTILSLRFNCRLKLQTISAGGGSYSVALDWFTDRDEMNMNAIRQAAVMIHTYA